MVGPRAQCCSECNGRAETRGLAMPALRDLLVILIDCLRSDVLFDGRRGSQTPNIDDLCRRGVSFPNTITAATSTTPSVASLLTGLYPLAHGVRSLGFDKLSGECPTLATVLSERSYETAAFVTGPLGKELGLDRGFTRYEYRDKADVVFGPWGRKLLQDFPSMLGKPWFVLLHLWELHPPRHVDPRHDSSRCGQTAYDRALSSIDPFIGELMAKTAFENTVVVLMGDHGERLQQSRRSDAVKFGVKRLARWLIDHSGPMQRMFEAVARSRLVPPVLQNLGVLHGYHVYDFLAKVPLVIVADGHLEDCTVIEEQVRTIDIAPTVLDLLGVGSSALGQVQGVSLCPLLSGGPAHSQPALVMASNAPRRRRLEDEHVLLGYRTGSWKLIFAPYGRRDQPELYDLTKDPDEKRNVADRHPDVVASLITQAMRTVREGRQHGHTPGAMSASEEQAVYERLRDLGYLG